MSEPVLEDQAQVAHCSKVLLQPLVGLLQRPSETFVAPKTDMHHLSEPLRLSIKLRWETIQKVKPLSNLAGTVYMREATQSFGKTLFIWIVWNVCHPRLG
jgi:hypothetical protein